MSRLNSLLQFLVGDKYSVVRNDIPTAVEKESFIPNLDPRFFAVPNLSNLMTLEEAQRKPYVANWAAYASARVIAWNLSRLPRFLEDVNKKRSRIMSFINCSKSLILT